MSALAWAGVVAAPILWFAQQQVSLWLLPRSCIGGGWLELIIPIVTAWLLLLTAIASWFGFRRAPVATLGSPAALRARFVGLVGALMPFLFLVAMAWQVAAVATYSGCER